MRLAFALTLLGMLLACGRVGEAGLPRGKVTIAGTTVGVDVARTPADRAQGLSGREGLAEGEGMLFLHEEPGQHGYWMKDMRFAIDILWIRAGRIVDTAHRVPPPAPGTPRSELRIYAPRSDADVVLEVPGGFARAHGWDVGVPVAIEVPDG
jgi:uncharacterized membrane protein (UPF0127 family)